MTLRSTAVLPLSGSAPIQRASLSDGKNPANTTDGNGTTLSRIGYTNSEMYLNGLAGDFR